MMHLEDATTIAEKIIDSDLMPKPTALAVIAAIQAAGGARVGPEHFIPAAKAKRAKVRSVAAACGWGRCWHCGEWRDVGAEPPDDPCSCPCVVEVIDDETWAALSVYFLCGGPIRASLGLPASLAARSRHFDPAV